MDPITDRRSQSPIDLSSSHPNWHTSANQPITKAHIYLSTPNLITSFRLDSINLIFQIYLQPAPLNNQDYQSPNRYPCK